MKLLLPTTFSSYVVVSAIIGCFYAATIVLGQCPSSVEECCISGGETCALCLTETETLPSASSSSKGGEPTRRRLAKQIRNRGMAVSDSFNDAVGGGGGEHRHRRAKSGKGGICGATLSCVEQDSEEAMMCEEAGGKILDCAEGSDTEEVCEDPWTRRKLYGKHHESVEGLVLPNAEEAMAIIKEQNADPDAKFAFHGSLLAEDKCHILVKYVDETMEDSASRMTELYKKDMTMDSLVQLIGLDSTLGIVSFFEQERGLEETINMMYISRAPGSNEERDF